MVAWYQKRVSTSAKSGRRSRVEGWVCSDERGPFDGDDLIDHHVCPAKARQIKDTALRSLPENHTHYLLFISIRCQDRLQAQHLVSHTVVTIHLVGDLGLCQNHYVEATNPFCLDGLCDTGSPDIMDVVVPED